MQHIWSFQTQCRLSDTLRYIGTKLSLAFSKNSLIQDPTELLTHTNSQRPLSGSCAPLNSTIGFTKDKATHHSFVFYKKSIHSTMDVDFEDESRFRDPQKMFAALVQAKKFSMATFPTLSEVQNQANERVKAIFDDRSSLLEILNRYVLCLSNYIQW